MHEVEHSHKQEHQIIKNLAELLRINLIEPKLLWTLNYGIGLEGNAF